jgi:hypothetical protein
MKKEKVQMNKQQYDALSKEEKVLTLEGVAYYSHLQTPDTQTAQRFNADPFYRMQLGLEGSELQKAKDFGLKIKPATEWVPFEHIELKRRVKDPSNPEASKPDLVDSLQNEIPSNILIGNGSKVVCRFGTYWYENQGGGVGTTLFKTQVRDLVPYTSASSDKADAVDNGGWTVGGTTSATTGSTGASDEDLFDVATG